MRLMQKIIQSEWIKLEKILTDTKLHKMGLTFYLGKRNTDSVEIDMIMKR